MLADSFFIPTFPNYFIRLREALLLLALLPLREEVEPLLREGLLLKEPDTEALLLVEELLLRVTLPLEELVRLLLVETEVVFFFDEVPLLLLRDTPALDELPLLLRDTLLAEALLRDVEVEAELLRDADDEEEALRELADEPLREALDELRVLLDELLRETLPEEILREEVLEVTAVRRFSSESTFTTRLFLSREGTLTYPFLRSRLLFS